MSNWEFFHCKVFFNVNVHVKIFGLSQLIIIKVRKYVSYEANSLKNKIENLDIAFYVCYSHVNYISKEVKTKVITVSRLNFFLSGVKFQIFCLTFLLFALSSLHWMLSPSFSSFSHNEVYYNGLNFSVQEVIVSQKSSNSDRKLQFFGQDYNFTPTLRAKIHLWGKIHILYFTKRAQKKT